jgi:hypothetical protein
MLVVEVVEPTNLEELQELVALVVVRMDLILALAAMAQLI